MGVTSCMLRLLRQMSWEYWLTDLEAYALLISALGHDIGHPGKTNPFLVATRDELAMCYNDRSPLENMHCCKLFDILAGVGLLSAMPPGQYKDARKNIIDAILHTDICMHVPMVNQLELLYEMNSKVFENCTPGIL